MTPAVVAGETSLGGSESACLGLARALQARGHRVTILAAKLSPDVPEIDAWGVRWLPADALRQAQILIDPDVFVALRQHQVFGLPVQARWRMLWNQDMLVGRPVKESLMSLAWAYDELAYVSQYQRKQWEGVAPELAPLGWVTRNGYDASLVPTDVEKVPGRIIHISRPERAMTPLLTMWPELKRRVPHAELHICRYASMYDGEGSQVKAMVEAYDREIARVQAEVGGIVVLGQLNKRDLYRAIASAEVMWYPGVHDFAETSCIAAIEAQACGTAFVGSYKGALPETVPYGHLVPGDAMTPEYQAASLAAVERYLAQIASATIEPRTEVTQRTLADVWHGRRHVQSYTYDAVAAEWEAHLWDRFETRAKDKAGIVAALLHEDDTTAARALTDDPAVRDECDRVMRGEAQTSEQYAAFALDPEEEMTTRKQARHTTVVDAFAGKKAVLDLACGNGAFAILLAEADPERFVTAIDYAQGNIDVARTAAARHGVAERTSFHCTPVCDLATGEVATIVLPAPVDGVFLGEFCEHVAGIDTLLQGVTDLVGHGVHVVITVPSGPFGELLPVDLPKQRGHVHHFRPYDLETVFGAQQDYTLDYLPCGLTPRGKPVGHWIVRYVTSAARFSPRPLAHWHATLRPKQALTVGILAHNATKHLNACLDAVWPIADEIIIADCGSEDRQELEHIATRWGATLLELPPVPTLVEGFSAARNATLAMATGAWFLWIDTDEILTWAGGLPKYLESGVFQGYALKQNHLMLDCPAHFDTPVRVFRKSDAIQFYGVVHEQPQHGDCNGDILPALQLHDVQIAHTGYLHEGIRRHKATNRNLPLLMRDRQVFPARQLGIVLVIRDLVTQAAWRVERNDGKPDEVVWTYYREAIALFEQHFLDPAHRLHALARPFYEQAVSKVRGALEFEWAFGGRQGGLHESHAAPKRFWVRTPEHIQPLVDFHTRRAMEVFQREAIDVEPVAVPEGVAA